jgi:hypothetical protein
MESLEPSLEELLKLASPHQIEQYKYLQKTYGETIDKDVGWRYLYISVLKKLPNDKYEFDFNANNPFLIKEIFWLCYQK